MSVAAFAASTLRDGRALLKDPALAIWCLYILLFPIYVFASGLPQPADILVALVIPVVLSTWDGRLAPRSVRTLRWMLSFLAYVILSALAWSAVLGAFTLDLQEGFLLAPIFYIFNGAVFVVALLLHRKHGDRFVSLTVRAMLYAAVLQVPLNALIGRGTPLRSSALFNTSNQLGYFAVLAGSIIVFGQARARLSTLTTTIGLLACSYLALISASKAALSGLALLVIIASIERLRTMLLASAAATILIVAAAPVEEAIDRAQERIETDQSYGFWEERGYDRITARPEYLVLGSGEGAYERFEGVSAIGDHELHSSIGTLVFCYGLPGTVLFFGFLFQIVRLGHRRQFLLLLPAAVYGLTHQGLRVSLLWVLLALFAVVGERKLRRAPTRLAAIDSPGVPT